MLIVDRFCADNTRPPAVLTFRAISVMNMFSRASAVHFLVFALSFIFKLHFEADVLSFSLAVAPF
jgi:hypothetical protein